MSSHLSTHVPNLQLAWDSTSLGELLFCPRRYQLKILQGWTPKQDAIDLVFGIQFHEAMEVYDHALADGEDWETGLQKAFDHALEASWGIEILDPEVSGQNYKTRFTLLRSVVWYAQHYQQDEHVPTLVLPDGKKAIELSFSFPLGIKAPGGDDYLLSGHMDGVVRRAGDPRPWVRERKTTKSSIAGDNYWKQWSPHHQVSVYSLASTIVLPEAAQGVMIDACQTGVNFSEFGRRFAVRTPKQLQEFTHTLHTYIRQAEDYAEHQFWPMNERMCWACPFKNVCGKDPAVRQSYLEAEFRQEEPWNPLDTR